jgi:vitamin-K-epoxide reductase (warfarin-sensitive)
MKSECKPHHPSLATFDLRGYNSATVKLRRFHAGAAPRLTLKVGRMRYFIVFLAAAGIIVSTLALITHYSVTDSQSEEHPLSRSAWNCSAVNHSPYAVVAGIPVAAFGIAGYTLLGILAGNRLRVLTAISSLLGLAYALYLTNIEAHILNLWCIYCVISLMLITLIVFLAFGDLIANRSSSAHGTISDRY